MIQKINKQILKNLDELRKFTEYGRNIQRALVRFINIRKICSFQSDSFSKTQLDWEKLVFRKLYNIRKYSKDYALFLDSVELIILKQQPAKIQIFSCDHKTIMTHSSCFFCFVDRYTKFKNVIFQLLVLKQTKVLISNQ